MNYSKSAKWAERARKVIPDGACTLSKRPGFMGPEGAYPLYGDHGSCEHPQDVDGNWFIDWVGGLGAHGASYSLTQTIEVELAEQLVGVLPGAEQVKFMNSGTEACMAAIATARAATGRTCIVTSDQSYHGWSDQVRAIKPIRPGVPEPMTQWISAFKYNDLDSLRSILHNDVAAVIMEPALAEVPCEGFLQGVKALAHSHGALFILDEMLLGFRIAIGGGSEFFGVVPDLATYGKPLGGGYQLGVLVGAERYMRHSLMASGTFCGHARTLTIASDMLRRYQRENLTARIWDVGERLMQSIRGAAVTSGAPVALVGYPVLPALKFTVADPDLILISLLQQELADRGVLIHSSGRLLPSYAHDDADLIRTARAFHQAFTALVGYMHSGQEWRSHLRAEPVKQFATRKPAWEVPA